MSSSMLTKIVVPALLVLRLGIVGESFGQSTERDRIEGTTVPRLIRFSGVVRQVGEGPARGVAELSFSLFREESGGEPLWFETQAVEVDAQGRYNVLLGAMHPDGLPMDLFTSGEARWLSIMVGKVEQPRVLLVSVPYALKAADAESLGGKPATSYVASDQLKSQVESTMSDPKFAQRTLNTMVMASSGGSDAPPALINETVPATITCTTAGNCVTVTQNGTGNTLFATQTAVSGVVSAVRGETTSPSGRPIFGWAKSTTGSTFGVWGQSASVDGAGVFGSATSATGQNFGLWGQSASVSGAGLYGLASAATGTTYGIFGSSSSTAGAGIRAQAMAATGSTMGVRAIVNSATGTAGVFDNLGGGKLISARTTGLVEKFSVLANGNLIAAGALAAASANFSGAVTAASFVGNGAGLTNVAAMSAGNADMLDGVHASAFATRGSNIFSGDQTIIGNAFATGFVTGNLSLTTAGLTGADNQTPATGITLKAGESPGITVPAGGISLASGSGKGMGYPIDTSRGGDITVTAGGGVNARGGNVSLAAGMTSVWSSGGEKASVTIQGGGLDRGSTGATVVVGGAPSTSSGVDTNLSGGSILLSGGNGAGGGPGGNIILTPGSGSAAGNVGIGTTTPGQKLTVAGLVESTSGGFKFPDGTTQATAASGGGGGTVTNVGSGTGLTGGPITTTGTLSLDTTFTDGRYAAFAHGHSVGQVSGAATLGANSFTNTQTIGGGGLSLSNGNISLPQTTSASAGVINLGGTPFVHACCSATQDNTFLGASAGNFATTGQNNFASGHWALYNNTTGSNNTATGVVALYGNATGSQNTASGAGALGFNTTGYYNTAIGFNVLNANTTGSNNTALGSYAGHSVIDANANVTGANNTFIGALSGPGTSTQLGNATALGYRALVSASNSMVLGGTGDYAVNVGIGTEIPTEKLDVVGNVKVTGSVTAASFIGDGSGLTNVTVGSASNLNCTGCVSPPELNFDPATQVELNDEAAARIASDAVLQTDINGRLAKSGGTMTGALNVPSIAGGSGSFSSSTGPNTPILSVTQNGAGDPLNVLTASMSAAGGHAVRVNSTGTTGHTSGLYITTQTTSGNPRGVQVEVSSTGNSHSAVAVDGSASSSTTMFSISGVQGSASGNAVIVAGVRGNAGSSNAIGGFFHNSYGGRILVGMGANDVEKFRVDGNGNVTAAAFIGDGSGLTGIPSSAGGTVTSVGSGTGLTGGPVTATGTLNLDTAFTDGRYAGLVHGHTVSQVSGAATLEANAFSGTQVITGGHLSVSGGNIFLPQTTGASAGVINLGGSRFIHACCSAIQVNTFVGNNAGNLTTTGDRNTAVGEAALMNNTTGYLNTATGHGALYFNTVGNYNTAIGEAALERNTTGDQNTATGHGALYWNTTGYLNTAIGDGALGNNTTGWWNTASGATALYSNTTGHENTATGYQALRANTEGHNNTASGREALWANTTGWWNTATGAAALYYNTTGNDNTGDGYQALVHNTVGNDNTASGREALWANTTGSYNTASGAAALYYNTEGHNNTAGGYEALLNNTTGESNTAFGYHSGDSNTTGSYNTFLGIAARPSSGDLTNASAIGANAVVSQSNSLLLGNGANVGIGTSAPSHILTIVQGSDTDPIADAWTTYSSRRWKTNIQTLQGALDKVQLLRGVAFDWKGNGKHDIGLIADEVGKVVPEVVSFEANGEDAKSVDYARLTALLIEALKEQQAQIRELRVQVERLKANLSDGPVMARK